MLVSQVQWLTHVIQHFGRLRQANHLRLEFKISLTDMEKPHFY